ncbi:growth arrest-specific protein 7a isoform X2 [Engraulis encrasicolus]|uniref:growth arrest-specific protein 7a isoform X2 n=1 Tax=Engraulis encrasicolus TaxID=184585 RepID=UPI002FD38852
MSRMFCRSLYAFSGKHDQALKFEVGEIIEVLQPLDSGWWEGQIAGVRGWFPANYVKVLEKPVVPTAVSAAEEADRQLLPPGWKSYLSPDGREYFVNSTTRETTWKRPSCSSLSSPSTTSSISSSSTSSTSSAFSAGSPVTLLPTAASPDCLTPVNGCQGSRGSALLMEPPDLALQKAGPDKQINGVTFPLPMCMPEQQLLKPNEWSYCDYFWTDKKDPQGGACTPGFEVLLQKQFKGKHLQKEMAEFIHERIKIEEEYAKNLSKLSMSPLAAQEEGTLGEAWAQLKKSLHDEAEVHLKFSSKLQSEVEKPLLTFRGDNFKKDLKKYEHSIADLRKQLLSRYGGVEKARKALADRQKDLETKTQQLEIKLSNKTEEDIKKARRKSTQAGDDLMRCVDLYNQAQSKWFEEMVTSGLELERLEVERVEMIQTHLRQYTTLRHETDMFNQSTLEPVDQLLQSVDPAKDRELWVKEHKTGEVRPVDMNI